jgi:hypothetical protein
VLSQLDKPQLPPVEAFNPALTQGPAALPSDPSKLTSLASGIAEGVGGMFDQISLAATSKLTDLKIKGGFLAETAKNIFTTGAKDKPKTERAVTQSAGVMQRGSAEAFSTIVKSMMGGKDPVVAATEKQTKELVKELKANKPPKLVFAAEF